MKRIFIDIDVNGDPCRIAVMDGVIIYDLDVRDFGQMTITQATKKIIRYDPLKENKRIIGSLFDKEE